MRSGITAVMIAIGVLFLSAGLMLFIAPLFWNSGIGYEGTYMLRDCVREVIGKGIAIDDDSSIALALILIFQGIRLMERRNRSIGSLLYSLWLLIPALLAISTLDSAPGSLPRLLSSILPGDPPGERPRKAGRIRLLPPASQRYVPAGGGPGGPGAPQGGRKQRRGLVQPGEGGGGFLGALVPGADLSKADRQAGRL